MVVGTDPELEERLDVPSETINLPDGDRVEIIKPSPLIISLGDLLREPRNGDYIWAYRNTDTRDLDERFGLNGEPILQEGIDIDVLNIYLGSHNLGNPKVASTLSFFVKMALISGYFVGFRGEDIIEARVPYFHPDLALEHKNGDQQPYLVKKRVHDDYPLFPRGLPDEFVALHLKAVA